MQQASTVQPLLGAGDPSWRAGAAAAPSAPPPPFAPGPVTAELGVAHVVYRCITQAVLRSGPELNDTRVGELVVGARVVVLDVQRSSCGRQRLRTAEGWLSATSSTGRTICVPEGDVESSDEEESAQNGELLWHLQQRAGCCCRTYDAGELRLVDGDHILDYSKHHSATLCCCIHTKTALLHKRLPVDAITHTAATFTESAPRYAPAIALLLLLASGVAFTGFFWLPEIEVWLDLEHELLLALAIGFAMIAAFLAVYYCCCVRAGMLAVFATPTAEIRVLYPFGEVERRETVDRETFPRSMAFVAVRAVEQARARARERADSGRVSG